VIIICINDDEMKYSNLHNFLTIGKKYKALNDPSEFEDVEVLIYCDNGRKIYYNHIRFIPLKDFRKNKLDKLNIKN